MRCVFICIIICFSLPLAAQDSLLKERNWLFKTAKQLESVHEFSRDKTTPLACDLLKNKRIVLLGESSHGIADLYTIKLEIISLLHRTQGFDVVLFEGGLADFGLTNKEASKLTSAQMMNNTVYKNWRCREMLHFFDSLKAWQQINMPMLIGGFDVLYSSDLFLEKLLEITSTFDQSLHKRISRQFTRLNSLQHEWNRDCQRNEELAIAIEAFFSRYHHQIISQGKVDEISLKLLKRAAYNYVQYWNPEIWSKHGNLQYAVRDYLMGENIKWAADSVFPGKKIVVWAHNSHTGTKIPPFTLGGVKLTAGDVVKTRYIDSCYSIGIFATNGEAFNHSTGKVETFDSNPLFAGLRKKVLFLDFRSLAKSPENHWLFQPLFMYQTESGGKMTLTDSFDAVVFLNDVKASKPLPD